MRRTGKSALSPVSQRSLEPIAKLAACSIRMMVWTTMLASIAFCERDPCPVFAAACGGFRHCQQFNEPRFFRIGICLRRIQPNGGKLIHGCFLVAGVLMIPLHSPLPASIQELAGDALASTDGGMKRLQDAIHVLGADGFGLIIAEKMIPGGETADDDDVFPTSRRNGSRNFREDFGWRDLAHGFGLGVRRSTNSSACDSSRISWRSSRHSTSSAQMSPLSV